jgi:hypothetical protein
LHAKELTARLDGGLAPGEEAMPLEVKQETLLAAVKAIAREFDLQVALDAKAVRAKTLDPNAKVSGTIAPDNFRISLTKMLEPLGLTIEVNHEVVFVTPKNK